MLESAGIDAEVADLRSLAPLDISTPGASVQKTGTLLTLEEGQVICGVGVEVIRRPQEISFGAFPGGVGALPAPASSNRVLE